MKYSLYIFILSMFVIACVKQPIKTTSTPDFWIWFTANESHTENDFEAVLKKLDKTGIKNVLVNGNTDQLELFVKLAKPYEINIHAWYITMNQGKHIRDSFPEWLSVNREGKSLLEQKAYVDYYNFVCPAIPEARQYIKDKIETLCHIKGLKGIHLDYIRYVDAILPIGLWTKYGIVQDKIYPQWDYGYHPYLRAKYKSKYGIEPMDIEDPEHDQQWNQYRYDQVTSFVKEVDMLVHQYNKQLTAAVFPTPAMASKMVYQDWGKWPLHTAFPMLYHNFYNEDINWIGDMVAEDVRTSHKKTKIVSGIFAPDLMLDGDLYKAINVSLSSGASGVAIFGLDPLKEDKRWEEVKQTITKLSE